MNTQNTGYTAEELLERMNFSSTKDNASAIKIGKNHNVNFGETLLQYCADNDIISDLDESGYEACENIMSDYGQADLSTDYYYFWIEA